MTQQEMIEEVIEKYLQHMSDEDGSYWANGLYDGYLSPEKLAHAILSAIKGEE